MRLITMVLMVAVCLLFVGCQSSAPTAEAVHPSISVEPPVPDPTTPAMVSGGALYRGVVTAIEKNENNDTILTLEQAKGTNFGYQSLQVLVNDNTNIVPPTTNLIPEMHVEVQYGAPVDGAPLELPTPAISLKPLMSVDALVFNGEVLSVKVGEKPNTGTFMLRRIDSEGDDWAYHYNDQTVFYISLDEIKAGDRLNIFTTGIANPSLPPQASALEIRPYYEN